MSAPERPGATTPAPDGPVWLLYPGHAAMMTEDERMDAPIFEVCRSLREARRNAPSYGACAIFTGEIRDGVMGDETLVEVSR